MFMNLVKLNEAIYEALSDNLEDIQTISIYEVDSLEFKKQLMQAQEDNLTRLFKFVEKHFEAINLECNDFYENLIQKLNIPMSSI